MARDSYILRTHFRHCLHQHFLGQVAAENRRTDPDLPCSGIFCHLNPFGLSCSSRVGKGRFCDIRQRRGMVLGWTFLVRRNRHWCFCLSRCRFCMPHERRDPQCINRRTECYDVLIASEWSSRVCNAGMYRFLAIYY